MNNSVQRCVSRCVLPTVHRAGSVPAALLNSTTGDILTQTIFAPAGWDGVWKAAKSASATTPCWVTVIGDSIETGSFAGSDHYTNGWTQIVKRNLVGQSLTNLYAEYFPAIQYDVTTGSGYGTRSGSPWVIAGGLTTSLVESIGWNSVTQVTDTGALIQTFTAPFTAINSYLHPTYQFGTFGYKVNGGTQVNVTAPSPQEISKISLGSISAGQTIQYGWQATSNAVHMLGVTLQKAITGIGFASFAATSAKLTTQAQTGNSHYPLSYLDSLAGKNPQTGNTSLTTVVDSTPLDYGFPTQPHLAIIALGVNDCYSGATAANYGASLDRVINALRRGRDGCSILLVVKDYPDQDMSDATSRIPTAAAPTVNTAGTPGATSYQVKVGWGGQYGTNIPGAATTISTGPATIDSTNFLEVALTFPRAATAAYVWISSDGGSTWRNHSFVESQLVGGKAQIKSLNGTSTLTSSDTSAMSNFAVWPSFVAEIYKAAYKHGCAVANAGVLFGSRPVEKGYMAKDIHPTQAGHAAIAGLVNQLV